MTLRPRALLDECLDPALVPLLAWRGFDVVSLQDIGPRGVDDQIVLERSTALGRVVVTQNARDFKRVHATYVRHGRVHGGIVCLPQAGPLARRELRIAMMVDWIAPRSYQSQLYFWGQLQQLLERAFRLPGYIEVDVGEALGYR